MIKKAKRHYVNNRDFYDALVLYRNKLQTDPSTKVPNYIGECIMAICSKLSTKPNFSGYSYRDEMIADGIENCIVAVNGFDPEKSTNPFAYFTQIAWNAFIRRISKEKKQQYIKHKNMVNSVMLSELDHSTASTTGGSASQYNEMTNEVIASFENKLTKSKKVGKIGLEKFVTNEQESVNESETPSASDSN